MEPGLCVARPGQEDRCGSATKTVTRDAGASSPHQVLPAQPGVCLGGAGEGGGHCWLPGSGDAGSGRFRVSFP